MSASQDVVGDGSDRIWRCGKPWRTDAGPAPVTDKRTAIAQSTARRIERLRALAQNAAGPARERIAGKAWCDPSSRCCDTNCELAPLRAGGPAKRGAGPDRADSRIALDAILRRRWA